MAKAKPKSVKSSQFGHLVRLADDVVADAKIVAAIHDTSMAELISDMLREPLRKMVIDGLSRRVGKDSPKKG